MCVSQDSFENDCQNGKVDIIIYGPMKWMKLYKAKTTMENASVITD
jgi:hypothetical protein